MAEVIRKANKDYICNYCYLSIIKGSLYKEIKCKAPRFNNSDKQIGIEYINQKIHNDLDYCNTHLINIGLIDPPSIEDDYIKKEEVI